MSARPLPLLALGSCPWTVATVGLAGLATLAASQIPWCAGLLLCTRGSLLEQGELWRLLSGPLVHAGAGHLFRDLLALLILGLLFERELGWRYPLALVLSLVAAPLAALLADPSLTAYLGLSGTTHAVAGAALAHAWERAAWRPRAGVVLLSAGLAAKLAVEVGTGGLLVALDLPPGVRPVPMAHLAGALCGLICGLASARRHVHARAPRLTAPDRV